MDYIITKNQQIAVSADNADAAVKAVMDGQGNVISVNYAVQQRPQQPQIIRQVQPIPQAPAA